MASSVFGWDLLSKIIEKDIEKKDDLIIAFTHLLLTKEGYSCIGVGDSKELKNETETELLPDGWNKNPDYSLRYMYNNELYILRASRTSDKLVINLLKASDLFVVGCALKIDDVVQELKGPISTVMPGYEVVQDLIERDLIDPMSSNKVKTTSTSVQTEIEKKPQHKVPSFPEIAPPRVPAAVPIRPFDHPRAVGRRDLDPFGVGGGMLFDPFQPRLPRTTGPVPGAPGGLPSGAVPPGARFDPFSPLGPGSQPGRRFNPDPDEFPPPGYDDMFM